MNGRSPEATEGPLMTRNGHRKSKHLSSQNLTASIEGAMVERLGTIRSW
jgi:hypothetical protein